MGAIAESILESTKKLIASDDYFDTDLIIHINTCFAKLQQMGVGPEGGFSISDATSTWADYTNDEPIFNMVKTYIVTQVRLYFDVSTLSSYVIELMKEQSAELEWRLNVACDYNSK